jgi:hypothetical protein
MDALRPYSHYAVDAVLLRIQQGKLSFMQQHWDKAKQEFSHPETELAPAVAALLSADEYRSVALRLSNNRSATDRRLGELDTAEIHAKQALALAIGPGYCSVTAQLNMALLCSEKAHSPHYRWKEQEYIDFLNAALQFTASALTLLTRLQVDEESATGVTLRKIHVFVTKRKLQRDWDLTRQMWRT